MRLEIVHYEPQINTSLLSQGVGMSLGISFNTEMDAPSTDDILDAIKQIYANEVEAIILLSDVAGNQFMQLPGGGFHVEYCAGVTGPVYSIENAPLELANKLFIAYAKGDSEWKTAVAWRVEIERL